MLSLASVFGGGNGAGGKPSARVAQQSRRQATRPAPPPPDRGGSKSLGLGALVRRLANAGRQALTGTAVSGVLGVGTNG